VNTNARRRRLAIGTLLLIVSGASSGADASDTEYLKIRRLLGVRQYAQALAAATEEARADPRSRRTLEALVEAGDGAGTSASAVRVLEELRDQDPANPYPHYALGLAAQNTKEYTQALAAFRRAIALAPDLALASREIAYTHRLLGTLDEAARELAAPLALDPENATAHYGLGFVFGFRGDVPAALAHLDRALARDPDLLDAYRYAAQLRFRAGDLQGALRLSRELQVRAAARNEPLLEAIALNTQAAASLRLAAYDDAVAAYQDALARQRELGDRQGQWSSLDGLGVAYDNLGQHDTARTWHREALAVAALLSNETWKATTLHNLGVTYAGERDFVRARAQYGQALDLRRTLGDRQGQAYTLRDLGMSHLREGDPARARPYLEAASAIAETVHDAMLHAVIENALAEICERSGSLEEAVRRYEQARNEAERIGYAEVAWRAERGLGSVSAARERWPEADNHYACAVETVELIRKNVRSREARMAFLQGRMAAYEEAVALQHRWHERAPAEGHDWRALQYAEKAKARTFLDLLADAQMEPPDGARPPLVEAEGLGSTLGRNERLVEFMIGDEISYAWLLGGGAVHMAILPARAVLERKVERYRALIGRPPTRAEAVPEALRLGRDLYSTLLGPFAAELSGATRVVVVPDGVLHYVPFETLVRAVDAHGRPQYVLDAYDVSYAPSASVLSALNRRPPASPPFDLLAYGDPALTPAPAERSASMRAAPPGPLLHARREIDAIAGLFPAERRRVRLGSEASERSFKEEDLSRFRIVHLATHGRTDARVPARSGLLLSPGAATEDGVLRAVEILKLDLGADLVVLSACGSGLGRLVRGEGLVGLTRAFLHAGARRVVVSLWNVDDEKTADLMKTFYGRLRQGVPADRALREAKRELTRSDRPAYRFPYYWGSFVLIGATDDQRFGLVRPSVGAAPTGVGVAPCPSASAVRSLSIDSGAMIRNSVTRRGETVRTAGNDSMSASTNSEPRTSGRQSRVSARARPSTVMSPSRMLCSSTVAMGRRVGEWETTTIRDPAGSLRTASRTSRAWMLRATMGTPASRRAIWPT
jgi:CHAT domain-containing protein/Flp pilus assembly protein TadD